MEWLASWSCNFLSVFPFLMRVSEKKCKRIRRLWRGLRGGLRHGSNKQKRTETCISAWKGKVDTHLLHQKTWIRKNKSGARSREGCRICHFLSWTDSIKQKIYQMGQVMRKRVLCHMQITKAQISPRIRAVWAAHLLFAARIVWYVYLLYPKFQDSS